MPGHGVAMMVCGYLGEDEALDDVMVEYADRFADRTETHRAEPVAAIEDSAVDVLVDL